LKLFSQRKGYKQIEKTFQREFIDDELRNRLWSVLHITIWEQWSLPNTLGQRKQHSDDVEDIVLQIWYRLFKNPTDTLPDFKTQYGESAYNIIRKYFFSCEWYEVYDFIEFVITYAWDSIKETLTQLINDVLESENAAYRCINNEITEITDKKEIESIETAIMNTNEESSLHIKRALELLSDKKNPDYRNSMKESISAVEATCQYITDDKKATLNDCLKVLDGYSKIHPALNGAFGKLYGYTSNSGGIRHALSSTDENPTFADAKFMLVACTTFCNYLITKISEKEK